MKFINYCKIYSFLLLAGFVSACTHETIALDSSQHDTMIREDLAAMDESFVSEAQNDEKNKHISLTLDQAIDRALRANMDARVAELEVAVRGRDFTLAQLLALPNVEGNLAHVTRNNRGASRSESAESGTVSLEPSISQEEGRQTGELRASWNLLDAALALYGANNAGEEELMAQERLRLVRQNIVRDVHGAYLRTLAAQKYLDDAKRALKRGDAQIRNLKAAKREKLIGTEEYTQKVGSYISRKTSLSAATQNFRVAQTELKSLLSYAPQVALTLAPIKDLGEAQYSEVMKADYRALELEALTSRADLREEWLNRNAAVRALKTEIFSTLPGLEVLFGYNYDNNRFAEDPDWLNFSASIAQNITRVFTTPWRLKAARADIDVLDARRQALSAAVIAQLYIARDRFETAWDSYKDAEERLNITQQKYFANRRQQEQGFVSAQQVALSALEYRNTQLQERAAQLELQDSYVTFMASVGRDIAPSAQDGFPLQAHSHSTTKQKGEGT